MKTRILKIISMFFWQKFMRHTKTIPEGVVGIPYQRDPNSPCEFYDPFKRSGKWYFEDCETDGHYLCKKCVHNILNDPL